MHSSWFLILERLVEAIYDADQKIFPHLTDLLTVIRLIPLNNPSCYLCACRLFFLIGLHKRTKEIVRDGLILTGHYFEVMIQVLISIGIVIILHLASQGDPVCFEKLQEVEDYAVGDVGHEGFFVVGGAADELAD